MLHGWAQEAENLFLDPSSYSTLRSENLPSDRGLWCSVSGAHDTSLTQAHRLGKAKHIIHSFTHLFVPSFIGSFTTTTHNNKSNKGKLARNVFWGHITGTLSSGKSFRRNWDINWILEDEKELSSGGNHEKKRTSSSRICLCKGSEVLKSTGHLWNCKKFIQT
jgi:hypothetical protein